jgi:hypothetical protein
MSALSPDDQVIGGVSDRVQSKIWSGLAERSVAIVFAVAALVAMGGWLYLLGEGLRTAASWLLLRQQSIAQPPVTSVFLQPSMLGVDRVAISVAVR